MTVHVQTAEHGKKSYPHADDYNYDPEFGYLDLFSGDKLVGTYPRGAWFGVAIEIPEPKTEETVDAELVPRVWQSVHDIPEGVRFKDNEQDTWNGWVGEDLIYVSSVWDLDDDFDKTWGPFTEVIA